MTCQNIYYFYRDSSWYQTSLKGVNWSLLLELYVSWLTNWQRSSIMLGKLRVNISTIPHMKAWYLNLKAAILKLTPDYYPLLNPLHNSLV